LLRQVIFIRSTPQQDRLGQNLALALFGEQLAADG
jgi:hypothetical protein